jgi:hypothetical protein
MLVSNRCIHFVYLLYPNNRFPLLVSFVISVDCVAIWSLFHFAGNRQKTIAHMEMMVKLNL